MGKTRQRRGSWSNAVISAANGVFAADASGKPDNTRLEAMRKGVLTAF
nr:MAG TPA: hypothetical protein [Caudoviricetes sp.]